MTKTEAARYKTTVTGSDRRECSSRLEIAVQDGIAEALKCGAHGLLVTRHDYTTFTVELSKDVPFGITLERDQIRPSGDDLKASPSVRGAT